MKLTVRGANPTGFRDVMTIVSNPENAKGDLIVNMRIFLYRACYGEFRNKHAPWVDKCEHWWKAANHIIYTEQGPRKERIQSSYRHFLVTKKKETLKVLAQAEIKMTKLEIVRGN
jgi:hypothetical protein